MWHWPRYPDLFLVLVLVSDREQKTRLEAIRALDTRIWGCPTIIHQHDKAFVRSYRDQRWTDVGRGLRQGSGQATT